MLLFLISGISVWLLLFQGFAVPALSPLGDFLLRLLAALSGQWLICRLARPSFLGILPAVLTSFFAVWGLFVLLTAPSWQHATFPGFLGDYLAPAAACWAVWWLHRSYCK